MAGLKFERSTSSLHLPREHLDQLVDRKRLLEQQVAIRFAYGFHFAQIIHSRQENERRVPVRGFDPHLLVEFNPVHLRHLDIRNNDVDLLFVEQVQCLSAIICDGDGMANAPHDFLEHLKVFRFVFDGKNSHGSLFMIP